MTENPLEPPLEHAHQSHNAPDADMSREQLMAELERLRSRVSELEESVTKPTVTAAVSPDELVLQAYEERFRQRFSRAFRFSPDAMSLIDLESEKFLDANNSFLGLFGFTREEVLGRTSLELGMWVSSVERANAISLLKSSRELCNFECSCRTKQGDTKTLLASCEIITLDGRDCILTLAKDITERKQAERHLQEALLREQQAIERERLIAKIAHNIRRFLDLQQILTIAVKEVRHFLQVDRVVIYQFHSDWSGQIVAESVSDSTFSLLNRVIHDPCFGGSMLDPYRNGRIHWIDDVTAANLTPCYQDLLMNLNVRAALVLPILVRQELWGLLAAHQCTEPRRWQEFNWLLLQQLSTQLAIGIYQANLYQQLQQQAQREQALNQVIQDIRNSLDLNTIFATATSEVGSLLQVDRAEIVQYLPDQAIWLNVSSYRRTANLPNALGLRIPDTNNSIAAQLKANQIVQVIDYGKEADCTNQPLAQQYPGSWVLVPLNVGDIVWGSLSLNRCDPQWQWQEWELDLVRAVANQLGIAIQQSQLYTEIQDFNEQLEDLVQFRTAQLQKALEFEALLKRMTDRVRDSLDEQQILQSAVTELTQGLTLYGCGTALYDLEKQISTICFEHIETELPTAHGRALPMSDLPDLYRQLLQGRPAQFCHPRIPDNPSEVPRSGFAILACPMIDNGQVIGDMWLFKASEAVFDTLEIRLAQQVANQCAIALRQSRLYQAAQAQVQELERLNRLKDDFLSTVSHELRTPMSSIKMATQMLEVLLFETTPSAVLATRSHQRWETTVTDPSRSTGLDLQKIERYFHILQDECDREIRLINDLLDLSRLDAGTEPLMLMTIDPNIWIPHIAEPFVELAHRQQQQLEFHLLNDLPTLTTDLSDLERVFTELLNNACKYSPPGARIIVAATVETAAEPEILLEAIPNTEANIHCASQANQPWLWLSVTNTGVEIPKHEQYLIFENFYRIPNNDPWKHGGTGLGLALVKKLLHRLQGRIHVDSGLNQTTFTIQLPLRIEG
ncbi:GAF domain-containing protein [Thermocoleostomius sinensis]|uniref:histidine kinase n=1 Tax=Thermocoleostomius sinensis A174 TaxID=2016057 RepID=A0A9E8ZIK4_9CYAN|nr:GAF domain-containing protein [Thermocoleostomius sinensis]WAL61943.1 GAF domain-containing protein [Thermocoleostomius sinensis A174]